MSEMKLGLGAVPSPKDIRDYRLKFNTWEEMPDTYYVVDKAMVKNQGEKPTCVAHALSEIVEYNYKKELGKYERFSTDFIYGLRDSSLYEPGEEGMYLREGLSVIKNFGDVFYSDLPSNNFSAAAKVCVDSNKDFLVEKAYPNRVSSYYKITTTEELRYSLMHHGAVAGGMRWYKHSTLQDAVYTFDPNDTYSGHAVIIIGWTGDYFIVQNSWGKSWGKSGLFAVKEEDLFKVFFELYGVTDDIQSVRKPTNTIKKIAPFINLLLRFIEKLLRN